MSDSMETAGLTLCDSHAHLTDKQYADDLDEVLERAAEAGVARIIDVGIDRNTSAAALEHAAAHPEICATAGLHPHDATDFSPGLIDFFDNLAADRRVVAIGETGLDRYYDHSPLEVQIESFEAHLELAARNGLPLVIHCREAYRELIEILRGFEQQKTPWQVHCFSGDEHSLAALIELDCYFSVGGMVTFKNYKGAELVRAIPGNRLLLETDCPYLAPVPRRGKRNEPSLLVHTAGVVAGMRGETVKNLARATTDNFNRLFGAPA
ncbi:MAG: TatD family deoxyribonuclease [Candidatus Glassbacteria bacterium]|nr:TatD family deoxyribonuclease [Candidatus Glassbacteria bacterium]